MCVSKGRVQLKKQDQKSIDLALETNKRNKRNKRKKRKKKKKKEKKRKEREKERK